MTAANGARPTAKDMGAAVKIVQHRLLADSTRAEGKVVSEMVKADLVKS